MHGLCCIYLAYVLTFCVVGESHKPLLRGSGFLAVGNMFELMWCYLQAASQFVTCISD